MIPYKFKTIFFFDSSSVKSALHNLIGIALNLWIALGSMVVLTKSVSSNPRR